METFSFKKLNKVEDKDKYDIEVLNRFAALEDLGTEVAITSAWKATRENIIISAKYCTYIDL
jgi:hypothetical protein